VLDIPRIEGIRLSAEPRGQKLVALGFLLPNYKAAGVRIRFEHDDRIPDGPVIYAMNHTDRFNYWPFQYRLWRSNGRFTATWVKGKYYENPAIGAFMERTNNLPTVSRGYIITRDVLGTLGRLPTDDEYRALRTTVDAVARGEDPPPPEVPRALLTVPRDILGRRFDPTEESWAEAVQAVFRRMMQRFLALHEEAFDLGLDLIVFPEGTRSRRLSRGHIGLAEVALHFRKPIVPVGCNGADRIYPGSSPVARRGEVVYRFGEPLRHEDLEDFHVPPFTPFDARDEAKHRDRFQALVDVVMERIDGLLDPPYRSGADLRSDGVQGSHRFV